MRPAAAGAGRLALSAALLAALGACDTVRLFRDYPAPESPEVTAAPYPRLVEVPAAPPPGQFSPAVPDPARGAATRAELAPRTGRAGEERERLAAPVIPPEAGAVLAGRGSAARERADGPVLTAEERARLERAVRERNRRK